MKYLFFSFKTVQKTLADEPRITDFAYAQTGDENDDNESGWVCKDADSKYKPLKIVDGSFSYHNRFHGYLNDYLTRKDSILFYLGSQDDINVLRSDYKYFHEIIPDVVVYDVQDILNLYFKKEKINPCSINQVFVQLYNDKPPVSSNEQGDKSFTIMAATIGIAEKYNIDIKELIEGLKPTKLKLSSEKKEGE